MDTSDDAGHRGLDVLTGMLRVLGIVNTRSDSVISYGAIEVGPGDARAAIVATLRGRSGTATDPAAWSAAVGEPLEDGAWLDALRAMVGYMGLTYPFDEPEEGEEVDPRDADLRVGRNAIALGNLVTVIDRQLAEAVGRPRVVRPATVTTPHVARRHFLTVTGYLVEGPAGRILFDLGWSD
ncbi:MAG: hypothetical protein ABIR11_07280 [Candidatus Limnocylindrales bacterium]